MCERALLALCVMAAAAGCDDSGSALETNTELLTRLDALEAKVAVLEADNATMKAQLDGLSAPDLSGYATLTDLAACAKTADLADYAETADLADYAKTADLADYLTAADLADYAKTADLADYLTSADLDGYVTAGDLSAALGGYVQTGALDAYATDAEVATALGGYVQTSALGGYVTDAELTSALGGYVQTGALSGYVTTATLDDYVTGAELESTLGDYVTQTALGSTLESYVTTAALEAADLVPSSELDGYVRVLRQSRTLNVPSDETPTLRDAFDWLNGYALADDVGVTIQLADGEYVFDAPLDLNLRDGARVALVGNPADPTKVVLRFDGSGGLRVRKNRALGWVEGLTLRGDGTADQIGVEVGDGGNLRMGKDANGDPGVPAVIVEGFGGDGVEAYRGGVVFARNVTSRNNGGVGFGAYNGGVMDTRDSVASGNHFGGFQAAHGSIIRADRAVATDNDDGDGFGAYVGSTITARDATSDDNGGAGFVAGLGSASSVARSSAERNRWNGFAANAGSAMDAGGGTYAASNGGAGHSAWLGSALDASEGAATGNGWTGLNVGTGSAFDGWYFESMDNNGTGVLVEGYSSANTVAIMVTGNQGEAYQCAGGFCNAQWATIADNLGTFGANVFWGGQMEVGGADISVPNPAGQIDYNIGPSENAFTETSSMLETVAPFLGDRPCRDAGDCTMGQVCVEQGFCADP